MPLIHDPLGLPILPPILLFLLINILLQLNLLFFPFFLTYIDEIAFFRVKFLVVDFVLLINFLLSRVHLRLQFGQEVPLIERK